MKQLALLGAIAALTACVPAGRPAAVPAPRAAAEPSQSERGTAAAVEQQGGFVPEAVRPLVAPDSGAPRDAGAPPDAGAAGDDGAISGDAAGPRADLGPSWDIAVAPYESHERVEFYVARYTGPARSWFTERLARGTRYEAMIRGKLRAAGLPEDMYYLAFVESGFDAHAYSRAAAVGMWQFMAATARGMNLRVDWWVDERRDPVRATDAAVRFLRSLHRQFGSLYLAAAAYNGGPNRVAAGLSRFAGELEGAESEDRYFALTEQSFLPRETKEYVPQLIAAALIGNDAQRYGIVIEQRAPLAYDSVSVPALTSLPVIARASATDLETIRDLNPQFIRGITAPRAASQVRIPVGRRAHFDSAFALVAPAEREGVRRERVAKPASLAALAREYGTTPRGITAFNPNLRRTKAGNVAAGQTLLVAPPEVAAAALEVADPANAPASGKVVRHEVKNGETLSHLARQYDTTVAALMRLNGMKKPMIRIGQQVRVR